MRGVLGGLLVPPVPVDHVAAAALDGATAEVRTSRAGHMAVTFQL